MSSKKPLDDIKIKFLLNPWLNKKSKHYNILNDEFVKSIIIKEVKKGIDEKYLFNNLEPFFLNKDKTNKFIYKLKKSIRKIHESKISTELIPKNDKKKNEIQFNKRSFTPERFNKKSEINFNQNNNFKLNKKIISKNLNPPPSYFLQGKIISLKKEDIEIQPLLLNEKGQQIDSNGNLIKTEIIKNDQNFKINYDKKIPTVKILKSKRFEFYPPGLISNELEKQRLEYKEDLSVASGFPIFDIIALRRKVETPKIDWWDIPYVHLDENSNPLIDEEGNWLIKDDNLNNNFQNSSPIPIPKFKELEIPTILTPEERKRLKHIKKIEKQNEERLLIKLNLKKPEPPRIKASRMIDLKGGKAILTPTAIENEIKNIRENRIKKHLENNEKNKLTIEEKRIKKMEKRKIDSKNNINIIIFKIKYLYHPLHFSKILSMAKKWFSTGGIFIIKNPIISFVIIESGPKGIKKFTSLMENRINWKLLHESFDENLSNNNEMKITFIGNSFNRHFYNFQKYVFDISTQCRKFFEKYNAEGYFDSIIREI